MEELEPVGFGIATVHTEHEKEVDILIVSNITLFLRNELSPFTEISF